MLSIIKYFYASIPLLVLLGLGGCGSAVVQPTCDLVLENRCFSQAEYNSIVEEKAIDYRSLKNFENQWELGAVNADKAYANHAQIRGPDVAPGSGVTLGFIDTGIDEEHSMFRDKRIDEIFLKSAVNETGMVYFSHGTAVASAAAGTQLTDNDSAPHGVAWGADIAMFAIPLGRGNNVYSPVTIDTLRARDNYFSSLYQRVLNYRLGGNEPLDFLNLSFSLGGLINDLSESELRQAFSKTIEAMAQRGSSEKTIFVFAAGNSHGNSCIPDTSVYCVNGRHNAVSTGVLSGLPAFIEELRGHVVSVVSSTQSADGRIASFSNRCGLAADFCIVAPGEQILAAYFGPNDDKTEVLHDFTRYAGTSLSAPIVTGGLAVMKSMFRQQLTNTKLVDRLFATANKRGIYADRSIYGQGLMDLGAATSPVGILGFTLGSTVESIDAGIQTTQIHLGSAFGDGFHRSFANHEVAVFDELGAPFWFGLGSFATVSSGLSLATRLQEFNQPFFRPNSTDGNSFLFDKNIIGQTPGPGQLRLDLMHPSDNHSSHLALAGHSLTLTLAGQGGLSATAFTSEGFLGQAPKMGAIMSWQPTGFAMGLQTGWLVEQETLLGSTAGGAFGELGANAAFFGIDMDTRIGKWRIGANAEIGTVTPTARNGLITGYSTLTTSTFSLRAGRYMAKNSMLSFLLSQPLRLETGRVSLSVPTGRTKAGEVIFNPERASLVPSGRQIDVAVAWHQLLPAGEFRFGTTWTRRPGHRTSAEPEWIFLLGWNRVF